MLNKSDQHTYILSPSSQLNTVVTDLNLSDNALGTEGTIAVADMLKENCYVTHLDLSDNSLSSSGAFALADMLTTNGTITHCNFSGQYGCKLFV